MVLLILSIINVNMLPLSPKRGPQVDLGIVPYLDVRCDVKSGPAETYQAGWLGRLPGPIFPVRLATLIPEHRTRSIEFNAL